MNHSRLTRCTVAALAIALFAVAAAVLLVRSGYPDEPTAEADTVAVDLSTSAVERGAYLARVGDCAACHTTPGGREYAGGRTIETPFGAVFSTNLTPDAATGIGRWSAGDFWKALHTGQAKGGRLLYPAFPYPNFTFVTRQDSDAIYAYLRTLNPVAQSNRPHALRFPYNQQAALAVWRALYFRAGSFESQPEMSSQWNRGAYLVRGLAHCGACHSTRNALGSTSARHEFDGGAIPEQDWYAPSLRAADEASMAGWAVDDVVHLLRTGQGPHGSVLGPMAEVVYRSTQHVSEEDLRAMASFLRTLPRTPSAPRDAVHGVDAGLLRKGAAVYKDRCAGCHADNGEGLPGAYPSLVQNRAVLLNPPTNVVRVVLDGGFAPATTGNPRPYGMPPFRQALSNAEVAAVVTYVRNAWGNAAGGVSEVDVLRATR